MPDFYQPSAPMPLETIEDIRAHLERGEASRAVNKRVMGDLNKSVETLQQKVKNLDDGQIEILRQMAQDRIELRANTDITAQVRDWLMVGRAGTSFLQWLGRVWPGLAVIGMGIYTWWHHK